MAKDGTKIILTQELHDMYLRKADKLYENAEKLRDRRLSSMHLYAIDQLLQNKNIAYIEALNNLKFTPVTIDEFIESEDFLSCDPDFQVWPSLRGDLRVINSDIFTGEPKIMEAFDGGATGTGKTHVAMITQLFQLYQLSCFHKPYKLWPQLSPKTPLVMMFQSVQEGITKRVIYEPFRDMFLEMPFVQKHVGYNRDKENILELTNGVKVVPALANLQKMVGQAIPSGIMDEVNFMAVVQDSKQMVGARGQGGLYDQAEMVYNNIVRRRKSRMVTDGPDVGVISVLSSTRYLGDFMDRRVKEIMDNGETEVHVMKRKQYEAQPNGNKGKKIRVLVGSVEYGTRILKDDEVAGVHYPERATVLDVPERYRNQFIRDPEGSLRDVCGVATDVIAPYITQRHKIIEAVMRGSRIGLQPWVLKADVELDFDGMPQLIEANLPQGKARLKPRFVHIDLSKSKDRCGIAIVKVAGIQAVTNDKGVVEYMPHYVLEQGISIQPSKANELDIAAVRQFILTLKDYYGINIHTVSFDGFQSQESMQQFRKAGILSQHVSMDETTEPYDTLKTALYQDRFDMQDHELLKVELAGLEYDSKKGKVDHSPHLSKDLSDAVAGAVYLASQNRGVRANMGVSNTSNTEPSHEERSRATTRARSSHRRLKRKKILKA